jgi:hypothetical protein
MGGEGVAQGVPLSKGGARPVACIVVLGPVE